MTTKARAPFWGIAVSLSLGSLLVVGVLVAGPVLHEYFDLDAALLAPPPKEAPVATAEAPSPSPGEAPDSEPSTSPGGMPASAYPSSEGPHRSADPNHYELDGNTSRPEHVGYSDPFIPSIPPFKRLHAYDSVDAALSLVVADRTLEPLGMNSRARNTDDQFLGVMALELSGQAVRIPSVGPMTRVLGAKLEPAAPFELVADSAENWFVRAENAGSRQLTLHLAIDRAVFGSGFPNVGWSTLDAALPPLPANLGEHAAPVLARLGLSRANAPRDVVKELVAYFRAFAPSDQRTSSSGVELYEAIALGQRGVCRHRSFAFVITALALGLPSRFVHNEAHAWVEVYDGELWHRIDLGGAAGDVELGGQLDVPHVAPADPFAWPSNSESGQDMVESAVARQSAAGGASGAARDTNASSAEAPTSEAIPNDSAAAPAAAPPASAEANGAALPPAPEDAAPVATSSAASGAGVNDLPPVDPHGALPGDAPSEAVPADSVLELHAQAGDVLRGARVRIKGTLRSAAADCSLIRMNVMLRDASGVERPLGVLVTDREGRFGGELVVPMSLPVGDYELFVSTSGNAECGPASSD